MPITVEKTGSSLLSAKSRRPGSDDTPQGANCAPTKERQERFKVGRMECVAQPPNTTAAPPSVALNMVLTFSERKFTHSDNDASVLQQAKRHLKAAKNSPKTTILDR